MNNDKKALIYQQFFELVRFYPALVLCEDSPGRWVIRGLLSFSAIFNEVSVKDTFSVHILIPDDYPNSPPFVQETGGRIPADFHQYIDRTLCLGAPTEVWRRFKADPRLLPFVQTQLIEYLYGYAYFEKYGKMPFGELSHGCQGIREYYQDKFNTKDVHITFALLKILADGAYRGHHACPCGSGEIIRKCHGPFLLSLQENLIEKRFLHDAENILYSLSKDELDHFNWVLLPKELKRELDSMAREKAQGEKYA